MIRTSLFKPGALTLLSGLLCCDAFASKEAGHHQFPHHHVALFAGVGFERDDHDHEEDGEALGIKYEVQWSEHWGVGVAAERLFGSGHNRSWAAVIPVSYYASESWRFFAGPGLELDSEKNKYLMRFGIAYEISLSEHWTASPEFLVDFIEGGAKTYVLGFAVGYGF